MKIRNGFVSNSSSSSFVVYKGDLTPEQKDMLLNSNQWVEILHGDEVESYGKGSFKTEMHPIYGVLDHVWSMMEGKCVYHFYTDIDNFNFIEFAITDINISDKDMVVTARGEHFWYENGEREEEIRKWDNKFLPRLRKEKLERILK